MWVFNFKSKYNKIQEPIVYPNGKTIALLKRYAAIEKIGGSINFMKWNIDKQQAVSIFEVSGSILAMIYALLIASNTGKEILGFSLLLLSALLFSAWAVIDKRWAFFALQFFYAASAIIGLIRWG